VLGLRKTPGLAVLFAPVFALALLPVPDVFPTRSLEPAPAGANFVVGANAVFALLALAVAARFFTLAPNVYVSDSEIGLLGALRRSRELARGRGVLFLTVALAPVALVGLGVGSAAWGEAGYGSAFMDPSIVRKLTGITFLACIAAAPVTSAVLKAAAYEIATRGTARGAADPANKNA
jgi:hypothetical protein